MSTHTTHTIQGLRLALRSARSRGIIRSTVLGTPSRTAAFRLTLAAHKYAFSRDSPSSALADPRDSPRRMMTIGRRLWDWAFPSQQPPWPPSTVEPSVLDSSCLYEEELVPIALQNFYPMQMGEVINDRYQITAKLGFGGRSTVWLARDLRTSTKCLSNYVSIKVTVTNDEDKEICDNELERLIHITHANRGHSGYYAVRTLLEHYFIHGPAGEHLCLVFEPLRDSLFTLKHHWPDHKVPAKVLKVVAKVMLQALNYLHTQCHIIHGGKRSLLFATHYNFALTCSRYQRNKHHLLYPRHRGERNA